jgi:hypothetical protein
VLPEFVLQLPPWLVVGLGMGVAASGLVALLFYVGGRLYPTAPVDPSRRVDGSTRRRAEIRDYLGAIDEPFAEDHPVHGRTIAFYLPSRDVAITFDAQAYFHIERAGTYAVLCEHEMPGAALGRRLPFEVPDLDPQLSELDDPIREAYDLLGLGATADPDEIKQAYRRRVKEVHPDHGGSQEEFKRLREAYTKAKDHAD